MNELRAKILIHLEEHVRLHPNEPYVDDTALAAATGASIDEVRRALDILEAQGLTEEANAMGSWSATISPSGSLFVESLQEQIGAMATKRKIGF